MVDNLTNGINPAGVDARVDALEVATCTVSRAVRVGRALRLALRVRVAKVSANAGAGGPTSCGTGALGISPTWAGVARVRCGLHRLAHLRDLVALSERIAVIAWRTVADGNMVPDQALGVQTAGSVARVPALLLDAGLVAAALIVDDTLGPAAGWTALVARVACTHWGRT